MSHHVLLIGGHGKIAQILTPLLLAKSWNVTSMIRSASQKPTIESLGTAQPGKLSILTHSLTDIKSETDAQSILDAIKPDYVIWSAGAGGRGGASATFAIDRDAAIYFTKASIHTRSVKKFLTVSYLSSRRGRPSWWSDEDWAGAQKVNNEVLPTYYKAKVAADEVLTVLAKQRVEEEGKSGVPAGDRFCGISLRPGILTDGEAGGVKVGKIGTGGKTARATVAESVVAVLETEGARGWIDVVDGEDEVKGAIERVVREGVDAVDEEDWERMVRNAEAWA
ncbi:hypothetical protein T440DRAFT_495362 [Plenodomus tracheiphilus IPT5]|uniref:NAD(P)-binding domain-containing protein n=1 Tax=Plenodomus tracheiphilus IPT5 TaxID=1408161 RepID=A0A6A7BJC1_9PLEO|nr:hypothetical protein T440DRAFT_495362 [Plenodomus tracheiphilus IPT5]